MEQNNKPFEPKTFKTFIFALAALLIVLLIFKAGMIVGAKKANFFYQWGDNYHRNFGGPKNGFLMGFGDRDFIDAHGTFGQIIKIDGLTLVIRGRDNLEKIIVIKNDTVINKLREAVKPTDLKIDDYVVVIGEPNSSGQLEARLIRIMPPPPAMMNIPVPPPNTF